MTLLTADRVLETSTTTGTGAFTLSAAVTGFIRFNAIASIAVGDTAYYHIEGVDGTGVPTGEWETGLGTYSAANTLTRTTVLASSNAGAAVSFSAGTKRVALSIVADSLKWKLLQSWTWSVNVAQVDFTGLGGYQDLMFIMRNVTSSTSTQKQIQCSVNNGSTFFGSAGDYATMDALGVETATATALAMHTTPATAARTAVAAMYGISVNGVPKIMDRISRDDGGSGGLFIGSTSPVNAIRFSPLGGNLTAGSFYVLGR